MDVLRNHEFRKFLLFFVPVNLISVVATFYFNLAAGWITLMTVFLSFSAYYFFTRWRYRQIDELAVLLKKVTSGNYDLGVQEHYEGELSILKSELYKVSLTLREQAELLRKDKVFLVDFMSDISHQLKTPLTSMFVMIDLLREEHLPPEKREEFINHVTSQLERLDWLVSSLLKLSKLDANAIDFKKETIYAYDLIQSATEHLQIPMEIKEISFQIEGIASISFTGDFHWWREAISNIVKNCMEHTPSGGRITVAFEANPLHTKITITDTGVGISQQDLPHIFDRFYQGKKVNPESVGIGLSMAKSIIQKQEGTISVESVQGTGTTFTIKIMKQIV